MKSVKKEATLDTVLLSGQKYTEGEEIGEFKVMRRKRFDVKPMGEEEAILQMNLLGHSFFIFQNQETEETNVVYKRRDGGYAIIEIE